MGSFLYCRADVQESQPDSSLGRALRGDHDALASLLEQHGPAVRNKLRDQIPRRWQALLSIDDVMQETYTDAFLDIGQFAPRGDGSFERWLTTIARHNLINAIKMLEADKRGGDHHRVGGMAGDDSFVSLYNLLGCTTTTPSREAARIEAKVSLERAIERLPDDYRRVVQMYDLDRNPCDVVAVALHRRPGAVFMLRARAHRALQKLLGAACNYLSDAV